MKLVFADDNFRKIQAIYDDDYKRRVCLEPKFKVGFYVFVNYTSNPTTSAELMIVEEYSLLFPRRLIPYCILEEKRKCFRIPQNGIENMVSIDLLSSTFTIDNKGNNQRLELDC